MAHKMLIYLVLACFVQGHGSSFITVFGLIKILIEQNNIRLVSAEEETEKLLERCDDLYPEELEEFVLPDRELLENACPKMIAYFNCEQKKIEDDRAQSDPIFYGMKEVLGEVCEKDSRLQRAYLESVDCFRDLEHEWPACHEAGQDAFLKYREFITEFHVQKNSGTTDENGVEDYDEDSSITFLEPYCMMNAFALSCLSIDVLERCGSESQKTFLELIQKLRIVPTYCPHDEAEKLRSGFFDFLVEKEQPHIETYRQIFNF